MIKSDLKFSLVIEELYSKLLSAIADKIKNVERDMRSFVFCFRDDLPGLKERYINDTSNWKEEEFLKRADNLI